MRAKMRAAPAMRQEVPTICLATAKTRVGNANRLLRGATLVRVLAHVPVLDHAVTLAYRSNSVAQEEVACDNCVTNRNLNSGLIVRRRAEQLSAGYQNLTRPVSTCTKSDDGYKPTPPRPIVRANWATFAVE